ncbi:MAG: uracil-DNA glycosylase family protein [Alphaproteobacteria bacterium]|nr:uracil-DNA glycosylase family protein [Alphaproteobacteria bacterium]
MPTQTFPALLREIRACTICAAYLPHEPRPVLRAKAAARIVIAGQAPGTRVHASGMPFTDPSGDRLRDWMGVEKETFYDDTKIAIVPMGFCFPGLDAKGGDLPPRKECAPAWRTKVFAGLKNVELTLLVGLYAQAWHLADKREATLTDTVKAWRLYGPAFIPLPHPSWRNNAWVKKNPWFEEELLPHLKRRVSRILKA